MPVNSEKIATTYMCYPQLCSHCGWLLLKCSAVGIGFNGAETNCGIAHILGILLMKSCNTDIFFSNYYNLRSVHFELQLFYEAIERNFYGFTAVINRRWMLGEHGKISQHPKWVYYAGKRKCGLLL